jgi:hypothetical protein
MQMRNTGHFGGFIYREVIYKSKETLEALKLCFEREGWSGYVSRWNDKKFVLALAKQRKEVLCEEKSIPPLLCF